MKTGQRPRPPAAPRLEPAAPPYEPAAYWSARLAADGSLEGVGWQGLGVGFNRWLYRRRAAVFRRVAREEGFDVSPPRVLELGPGNGFYVALWRDLGVRDLTGVDIAPPAVERLRCRFPGYRFLTADIGRPLALPPASVDAVTAFDVLFHITEEAAFDQALATVAAALRPGGVALVTDLFPRRRGIRRPHHVSRTEGRYRAALEPLGLRLERRLPVFILMHPWPEPRSRAARWFAAAWWAAVERSAGHVPGAGAPLGALLYGVDNLLARRVSPGPSTQLWVLRRDG